MILINSILILTILHQLVVFIIPQTIVHKLDGLLARFVWSDSANRCIHWRKRALLHLPKGMGGLDLRSIGTFNKVFLMHKAWRIHQHPQLLLSRTYHTSRLQARRRSLFWGTQGIRQATKSLKHHCAWKVGNGRAILEAHGKWVNGPLQS